MFLFTSSARLILLVFIFCKLLLKKSQVPYARHYNPQFVYFLKSKNVFSRGFFLKILLVFKSGFKSRAGYDGVRTVCNVCQDLERAEAKILYCE